MNSTLTKPEITIDEYITIKDKLSIRIGQIIGAEPIPKSNGLKLTVVFSEDEVKTAFTNLGKTHKPEEFIGLACPFIMNLAPVEIKGVLSQVMIMVAEGDEGVVTLNCEKYPIGSILM